MFTFRKNGHFYEKIGKKGVVRDPGVHTEVVEKITQFAVETGFKLKNLDFSPIKGPEGNIEYLMYLKKTSGPDIITFDTDSLVNEAFKKG